MMGRFDFVDTELYGGGGAATLSCCQSPASQARGSIALFVVFILCFLFLI